MFNTNIPFYNIAIILCLLLNIVLVLINSQKNKNFNNNEIIGLILYENIGIILGAKILFFFLNYEKLSGKFNIINLGLSAYGAVIGAILLIILFSYQFKKNLKETFYIFFPSFPLMYSIGKLGCFLVGCCYGIEYNGFGKIIYKYSSNAPNNIYLFPVQLLESIIFFIIFIFVIYKYNKKSLNIKNIGVCSVICGITKFLFDFLRMSHMNTILSVNQYISILFIAIGFILLKSENKLINN